MRFVSGRKRENLQEIHIAMTQIIEIHIRPYCYSSPSHPAVDRSREILTARCSDKVLTRSIETILGITGQNMTMDTPSEITISLNIYLYTYKLYLYTRKCDNFLSHQTYTFIPSDSPARWRPCRRRHLARKTKTNTPEMAFLQSSRMEREPQQYHSMPYNNGRSSP